MSVIESFMIDSKVVVITGGAGLLGIKHAETVLELGGTPILVDIDYSALNDAKHHFNDKYSEDVDVRQINICLESELVSLVSDLVEKYQHIDVLINNAANNPKVDNKGLGGLNGTRLENYTLENWNNDLAVGITGAFLCSRLIGQHMASNGGGVIVNISSDLGVIAPDQRLYRKEGLDENQQPVKPVTYSVTKFGLIGLTKYLSTYWINEGVRCNALAPGGVHTNQDEVFQGKLTSLIPMGRMADKDEYKAAVAFLMSDASSYMNGAVLSVDGGRTAW